MENQRPEIITATRLIVRVLQDVTAHARFDNYADLAEALKARCARLRIVYDSGLVSAAIDRLELGGKQPLVTRAAAPPTREVVEVAPINREEAARIIRVLPAAIARARVA